MHVLPDPEDLVDDVEGVDLELVVCVFAGDEELEIVLLPDLRVALGQRAPDVGFHGGEAEVEVGVVPEQADAGVEPGRFARHDIDERVTMRAPVSRPVRPAGRR